MRDLLDIVNEVTLPPEIKAFARDNTDEKIVSQVQMQAARKNPAWKRGLVKSMKAHGFALVGTGINGAVFQHPDYPYVIKVYRRDQGYDEWLYFCQRNAANTYVPKLRGQVIRLNAIFSAVRIEKLQPCPSDLAGDFIDRLDALERRLVDWRNPPLDAEPDLLAVAKFTRDWESHGDVTPHNIMQRANGEVVLIDPINIDPTMEIY